MIIWQLFTKGEVNIGEHSPIFTEPEANNCFSIISEVTNRENDSFHLFSFRIFPRQKLGQIRWQLFNSEIIRNLYKICIKKICIHMLYPSLKSFSFCSLPPLRHKLLCCPSEWVSVKTESKLYSANFDPMFPDHWNLPRDWVFFRVFYRNIACR